MAISLLGLLEGAPFDWAKVYLHTQREGPERPTAVWTIPPTWEAGISETLEWKTTINTSPTGVEQRMGMRLSPRRWFDVPFAVWGETRTFFDLVLTRLGGSPLHMPLWYDVQRLTADAAADAYILPVSMPDAAYSDFSTTQFALVTTGPFNSEVVEVAALTPTGIYLRDNLTGNWPQGSRVFPLWKCRVKEAATVARRTSKALTATVRFESLEANTYEADASIFLSRYLIDEDPNEADDLSYVYDRLRSELDNDVGLIAFEDITSFVAQEFTWYLKGRINHRRMRKILYALQGRLNPVWVPSVNADFDLVTDISNGDSAIEVKQCGFTSTGGPTPNRRYIVILLASGDRVYRKIVDSAIVEGGATETVGVDSAFTFDMPVSYVKRISFLTLSRLDQDAVELIHQTDNKGLTTAKVTFRNLPNRENIENED